MAKVESEAANTFLSKQSQYDRHPYLALPLRLKRPRSLCCMYCDIILALLLALLIAGLVALIILWPSKPEVKIIDIQLNNANISTTEHVISTETSLSISLGVKITIRNRDFVTRKYDKISMFLKYQGRWIGNTTLSGEESIDARNTKTEDLTIQVDEQEATSRDASANADIVEGTASFDFAVEVGGKFKFLLFNVLVKGRKSCKIIVDTDKQSITDQTCYSKT